MLQVIRAGGIGLVHSSIGQAVELGLWALLAAVAFGLLLFVMLCWRETPEERKR